MSRPRQYLQNTPVSDFYSFSITTLILGKTSHSFNWLNSINFINHVVLLESHRNTIDSATQNSTFNLTWAVGLWLIPKHRGSPLFQSRHFQITENCSHVHSSTAHFFLTALTQKCSLLTSCQGHEVLSPSVCEHLGRSFSLQPRSCEGNSHSGKGSSEVLRSSHSIAECPSWFTASLIHSRWIWIWN